MLLRGGEVCRLVEWLCPTVVSTARCGHRALPEQTSFLTTEIRARRSLAPPGSWEWERPSRVSRLRPLVLQFPQFGVFQKRVVGIERSEDQAVATVAKPLLNDEHFQKHRHRTAAELADRGAFV